METFKIKRVVCSLVKDLPCILCLSVVIASVTLHVTAVEEQSKTRLQDDQTATFTLAKRSKDNQHKFGWGKRSRAARMDLDEDMFEKRTADGTRYATVTDTLCKQGEPGCTFTKLRIPIHGNGWNGGYGKRSLQDDDDDQYDGEEERDELDTDSMEARGNDDRNGWGGNYGRDLDESSNELRALLGARKRVFDKRHGNGWNGAYGKRSRNGWNSAYGKKKRSVSQL